MTDRHDIIAQHRVCGKPKFDGCYAHYPWEHCRADGMKWPCDVVLITEPRCAFDGQLLPCPDVADDPADWCQGCIDRAAIEEADRG